MFRLTNVMENLVLDTIEEILSTQKNICGCQRCKLDMAAIALNKLPTSYVVTAEGEVLLRVNSLKQQLKVDIIRTVTEAMALVSKNPHHARENT